jgi:hypothetical protein
MDLPRPSDASTEELTDQALRTLPDSVLARRLDQAARALRFHQACDSNGELDAERFWRRFHARLRLESERRRGPLLQAPGALADKVVSCRRTHQGTLDAVTREARQLAEAQRCACRRARRASLAHERRAHRRDAQSLAAQFARLNRSRRSLRRLVADADAALAPPAIMLEAAE